MNMRLALSLFACALSLGGCNAFTGRGDLRASSLGGSAAILDTDIRSAYYEADANGAISFMLADVPAAQIIEGALASAPDGGQIVHLELLWIPKPGATPIESSATNVMIRYAIVCGGEVGVYAGAGFAMPVDEVGDRRFTIELRHSSLQLTERTEGFRDLLSPLRLTGKFTAARDDRLARRLRLTASQILTNALGRTQYVMH